MVPQPNLLRQLSATVRAFKYGVFTFPQFRFFSWLILEVVWGGGVGGAGDKISRSEVD